MGYPAQGRIARELGSRAEERVSEPDRASGVTVDYDVVEARHIGGFVIWLRFRDGTAGEIDLEQELYGPVFEPLRDAAVFKQFRVHEEFRTLVWPNGADFAPEFLHDNVRVTK